MDQQTLDHAIKSGRTDFSGVRFTEEINLTLTGRKLLGTLCFDRASLGPDFTILDWNDPEGTLSMIDASIEDIYLKGVRVRSIHCSLSGGWLEIRACTAEIISLANSRFHNGFKIVDPTSVRLDLTNCASRRSFFSETDFGEVITAEATLGERSAQALGELIT